MKVVQKENRQLRVADDRLETMRQSGYVEVDTRTGKPVPVPEEENSAAALKRENAALKKENRNLKEQIEGLTVQLSALNNPPENP